MDDHTTQRPERGTEPAPAEPKPQVERLTRRLDHSIPEPLIFDDQPDQV